MPMQVPLAQFFAVYGSLINFIGINSMLALSLYVTLSAGQLSLGNAAFAGIGAYTAGILTMHLGVSYLTALIAAAAMAGLVGAILGFPVLRLRGVFLAMATLAFGEVVRITAVNLTITGGAEGLTPVPNKTKAWMIYLALAAVAYFVAVLRRSKAGWSFAGIREDETAASALGINTTFYKTMAFTVGAMIAGLAGAMNAHLNYIITPGEFGFSAAVQLLIYNIVGGTRVWYGPILGAALLTSLPEILRGIGVTAGPIRMGVNGLILLVVILFLPNGLVSLFSRRRRDWTPPQEAPRDEGTHPVPSTPLEAPMRAAREEGSPAKLMEIHGITQYFGGLCALSEVRFDVHQGEIHGLIGPNGAGKTTLLNILSGLMRPTSGRVLYAGKEIETLPAHRVAALGIARTFQNIRLFPAMTCLENVIAGQHLVAPRPLWPRLLALPHARRQEHAHGNLALETLSRVGLEGRSHVQAKSLSYGERRRLEIARALAAKPRLLLLDEPVAGMRRREVAQVAELIRTLAGEGMTIFLIEHNMSFVMELCSQVTVLNFGRVIATGPPAEVRRHPQVIEAYLGVDSTHD